MTKLQKKIKTLLANWNESHTPLITNTKDRQTVVAAFHVQHIIISHYSVREPV